MHGQQNMKFNKRNPKSLLHAFGLTPFSGSSTPKFKAY
jgi:hypothetical protein